MTAERSQRREALLGSAALAVLLLIFLAVFFAADVRRLFMRTDDLYVLMPSAAGLREGAPVWIAGQTVGEVTRVLVRPPGTDSLYRVLVEVEIRRKHRQHVRADSEARVTSFRLMDDPVLDITPGTPSLPGVQPNDTLYFRAAGTPAAALQRALSLRASLQELLATSQQLNIQTSERSDQLLRVQEQLARSARELRAFSAAVRSGPLNTLNDPRFTETVAGLGQEFGKLRERFAQSLARARSARAEAAPALERLTARADTISTVIAQLQREIESGGGGLLIRAQRDSAIIKALHGAQAQFDSLVAETKRNPLRFWF